MATKLRAFWLGHREIYPFYARPCKVCSDDLSLYGRAVEIDKLAILDKTPEEIMRLDETEKVRLRSILPKGFVIRTPCRHLSDLVSDTDSSSKHMVRDIGVFDRCGCNTLNALEFLRCGGSSSCPFCARIICGEKCFIDHLHMTLPRRYISFDYFSLIDRSLLGGEWCPLCRKVFRKGARNLPDHLDDKECTTKVIKELLNSIEKGEKIDLAKYTIKNTLCSRCSHWNYEKMIVISPTIKLYPDIRIYPSDIWVPPYFSQQRIRFFDLASIQTYDDHPQFFIDLLKHKALDQISDSLIDANLSGSITIYFYLAIIWRQMLYSRPPGKIDRLHTPEEVKATAIPGSKFLAAIRAEIIGLDACLTETRILPDLCLIIREYLPWQLWNMERLLSRIHNDILRYAPSVAALLSIIGG
ncbi:MAG: hypothetical protein Hyperionvirus6_89 [Hyperionvirus sp.]|uniref:Uncharacterized protein n=1 Tax=Hyperionvirus sp. TaxID=2487770 RepID=A0A3G5A884_9VIRU|nr:MAG: hypothetical protein Hyperionvirus6_89 [Hyperionvirus sp.]